MKILRMWWTICIITLLSKLLVVAMACPSDTCAIINSTEVSLAMQVINLLRNRPQSSNHSFTFYISPGTYNATNGTRTNFYFFSNITFQKDPTTSDEVTIQCPYFTSDDDFNSLGFVGCSNISIIGLTFTGCGTKSFGSFFQNASNLYIADSFFYHNLNNGIGIRSGFNVTVINCTFERSVGLQNDSREFLIQQSRDTYGGASLGISLQDISTTNINVENCTFRDNVALKCNESDEVDTRPYNYIPFGNGGAIYINLNNVTDVAIKIKNCYFYNNTALHQGGGIVTFMTASSNNLVEVVDCEFIGNKAIGYPVFDQICKQNISNIDNFIEKTNVRFNVQNFGVSIRDALSNISSETVQQAGGFGGAMTVNFFRECENNRILVNKSIFKENLAIASAGIGIFMREGLSSISSGVNSNRAWISGSQFINNHALLGGAATAFLTRTRVDIANSPSVIENCTFNKNINQGDLRSSLFRFGSNGAITTVRAPLTFLGVNQFDSNIGGCININNAKVDMNGTMNFTNNTGTPLGGAIRIVGFSLVQLFPGTNMIFANNSAQRLGGAIGVDNVRVEEDLALILNYNCFLQYNIGNEDEFYPSNWKANISFNNNTANQGSTMYMEDISRCTSIPNSTISGEQNVTIFGRSFFSFLVNFEDSHINVTNDFVTAPSKLLVNENETLSVFPGEEFFLSLRVLDQNNNKKVGFYTYPSNALFTMVDIIEIDLTTDNRDSSFGIINEESEQGSIIVVRNASQNFSFFNPNSTTLSKTFTLSLIDSSTGLMIDEKNVTVNLRSCHFLYIYNRSRGNCQFIRYNNKQILRGDNINTYFYIQSEMYGELEGDTLRTARIPPFYQSCNPEGGLPGCLVKYDNHKEQCSEGRSGFLCGKCPYGSENEVQGLAFNLIECVSCESGDRILFVFICIFIVVASILIMYYNIGLPNSLRGFLFYSQMIGYVYVSGARQGRLNWDLFLSRVFGFSLYFPICLARMKALQVALFGFLPPLLVLMSVITYTILARHIPRLSNKKTLDGIWFLVLIIYVYTFDTCCNLLRCIASSVYTNNFSEIEFHSLVYFYDGSVTCYQDEHIFYAVISILVLLIFILPFPFVVVAISYNYFKKAGPFCDVINNKIKPNFRWWSGYDLFRRLLFVATYFIVEIMNRGDYTQYSLTVCAILTLIITSRVHPYDRWGVNLIECVILLDLVLIAALFVDTNQSVTGSSFGRFLFILPYIFLVIYVVTKFMRKMKLINKCRRIKLFKLLGRKLDTFTVSIGISQNEIPLNETNPPEEMQESTYIREPLIYND